MVALGLLRERLNDLEKLGIVINEEDGFRSVCHLGVLYVFEPGCQPADGLLPSTATKAVAACWRTHSLGSSILTLSTSRARTLRRWPRHSAAAPRNSGSSSHKQGINSSAASVRRSAAASPVVLRKEARRMLKIRSIRSAAALRIE